MEAIKIKTLVLYDEEGKILFTRSAGEITNAFVMNIEIPEGKQLVSINMTDKSPVYEDRKKSQIELLQEQVDAQAEAILALMDKES